MIAGLLVLSLISGEVISRTGKYRAFPIGGTADIAAGLLLLSTLSSATSLLAGSAYLLLLGVGIGSVIQVLVLITQNPCRGPAQMDRLGPHPRPRGRDGQVVSCEAVIREAGQLLWPGKDHPPLPSTAPAS